jgi:hypothetical protein
MKVKIKRISPLQLGKMLAITYAFMSVIIIPFIILGGIFGEEGSFAAGIGMALIIPILYIVMGFISGIIGAFIYNLAAGWIGGIEMEFNTDQTA